MIENQLNERNIIIKKWYMHACDKKKYINCGKILPAEIYWFNCYQLLSNFLMLIYKSYHSQYNC